MAVFYLSQFEHVPFWQYFSRLNDYRVHCVYFTYKKWEICNVILGEITYETGATHEFMCYGGMCSLNADDMWDLFESLAWYRNVRVVVSLLCALPPFLMVCMLNPHVQVNLGPIC